MPLIEPVPDVVEVRPQRRRHPGLVVLGTVVATALLLWGGFAAVTDGEEAELPDPDPVAVGSLTPEQKTALVWNEWSAATLEAECLDERGHDLAPAVMAYRSDLSEVAALLTVHAAEPEGLSGYLPRGGAVPMELLRSIDAGGCRVVRDLLDLDDDSVVDGFVRTARSDAGFLAYLAGALWVDANRAVVLASYLDLVEPGGGADNEAWDPGAASAALSSAISIAENTSGWSLRGRAVASTYAQAWGEAPGGAVILLRVEPRGAVHREPILWGSPESPVECGDLQLSLSMGEVLINYDGPQRGDVFAIRDALVEQWCEVGVEALGEEPGASVVGGAGESGSQQ